MAQPLYIEPPFDPTAYPSISGAQLLQYLSGAKNTDESGFNIWTEDVATVPQVPDADTYPELQRFMWIRQSAASVSAYVWNTGAASHATYLKWIAINIAGIAVGSITGDMIADNTIPDSKIISLDWSKIIGAPDELPPSGAAGGDLDGTYPNPQIANEAVTTGKINDLAVTTAKIDDEAVTYGKLAPNGVGLTLLRTNAGATAVEWFVPQLITLTANPAGVGDAAKVVRVNAAGDGFELVANNNVAQKLVKLKADEMTLNTVIPLNDDVPQDDEGDLIVSLAITPKSATNLIRVTFSCFVSYSALGGCSIALFKNGSTDALQAVNTSAGTAQGGALTLDYCMVAGGLTEITFTVRGGPSAGITGYLNQGVATPLFGAAARSYLFIEEFQGTLS